MNKLSEIKYNRKSLGYSTISFFIFPRPTIFPFYYLVQWAGSISKSNNFKISRFLIFFKANIIWKYNKK